MHRYSQSSLMIVLALVASATIATPAHAGPPWVSVEYPSNPFDRATRGSLFTIHTYHHGLPMQFPVTAFAEGIVNGRRQTIALSVAETGRTGVLVVNGTLPAGGSWVIAANMTDSETSSIATALIAISSDGAISAVKVPSDMKGGWIIPRKATTAEIEAMLRTSVALNAARQGAQAAASLPFPRGTIILAGLGLLLLFPAGAALRRRN